MQNTTFRASHWLAGIIAVGALSASFPSHAFLGLFSKCPAPKGTVRIVEPDDGMGAWATYGLPAPTRLLRVLVIESNCFTVLDRGVGFAAAQAERELAMAGHLQDNQNIGGGQMLGADFVLIPDIVSQNANAGGSHVGADASSGKSRGLMGAMFNVATLGVSGKMTTKKQTAEVVLTLVDVRTSQQLISINGEAKITDKAWSAAVAASNAQGQAGVTVGRWDNTEIGKVIKEAYEEAYARMAREVISKRGLISDRAANAGTPPPPSGLMRLATVAIGVTPPPGVGRAAAPAAAPEVQPVAAVAVAQPVAQPVAMNSSPAAAVQSPALANDIVAGASLVLRRTARLLSMASNQAETVAELRTGMLVFPTGGKEGNMLEVEDEMGNKGWVPAAAVTDA